MPKTPRRRVTISERNTPPPAASGVRQECNTASRFAHFRFPALDRDNAERACPTAINTALFVPAGRKRIAPEAFKNKCLVSASVRRRATAREAPATLRERSPRAGSSGATPSPPFSLKSAAKSMRDFRLAWFRSRNRWRRNRRAAPTANRELTAAEAGRRGRDPQTAGN